MSDFFERRPSAGKQVQWADAKMADEKGDGGGHALGATTKGTAPPKDTFGAAIRGTTARSSATAKSRANTAIDALFATEDANSATEDAIHRRPWSLTEHDPASVIFCGLRLSIDDFVRARGAKTGQVATYSVSKQVAAEPETIEMIEEHEPVLFSPVVSSPLSQMRGARLQRRASRAEGLPVAVDGSSDEDLDFAQIEFGILKGDAAEVHINESAGLQPATEVLFSRVSSTESISSKKELKKRVLKKKKTGHASKAGEHDKHDREFVRVASSVSQGTPCKLAPSFGRRPLSQPQPPPFEHIHPRTLTPTHACTGADGTVAPSLPRASGVEAPQDLTGNMKIATLEKDMTVQKIVAADASIQVSYDDASLSKTFVLDLEAADEVADVADVLSQFTQREESTKYLSLLLGRTGFGTCMCMYAEVIDFWICMMRISKWITYGDTYKSGHTV